MKKMTAFLLILIIVASNFTGLMAATPVKVYCDGQEIIYDYGEASPQFVGQDVMIPVRKTAESLGMAFSWNPESSTMTFTKGGRVVTHTINQSVIYVNNQQIVLGTPSMIIDGRTMMSANMMAAATGYDFNVNRDGWAVQIYTQGDATRPNIITVSTNTTSVGAGDIIEITAVTNRSAKGVRMMDSNYQVVAQSTSFVASGDTRKFIMKYKPDEDYSISKSYIVYAGDGVEYYQENAKSVAFTVSQKMEITSIEATRTNLNYGDSTVITVRTNSSVSKVKLTNNQNSDVLEKSSYETQGNGRYFEFSITPRQRQNITYTAYAGSGSSSSYSSSNTKNITIYYGNNNSSSSGYSGNIRTVSTQYANVKLGTDTKITIETNNNVDRVEIRNSSNSVIKTISRYDYSSGGSSYRTWSDYITVNDSGTNRYTVYAFDRDNRSSTLAISLTGTSSNSSGSGNWTGNTSSGNNNNNNNNNNGAIRRVDVENNNVSVGRSVRVIVETDNNIDYVEIRDDSGRNVTTISNYSNSSSSSGYRTWYGYVDVSYSGSNRYTAYAYDYDRNSSSYNFTINGDGYNSGSGNSYGSNPYINRVSSDKTQVTKGESVYLTVETNEATVRVWVEDPDGKNVASSSSYDSYQGDWKKWNLRFLGEKSGTYKVTAENSKSEIVTNSINIRVDN